MKLPLCCIELHLLLWFCRCRCRCACHTYQQSQQQGGFARHSCLRDPVLIHREGVLSWQRLEVRGKNHTFSVFHTKWSMQNPGGDNESIKQNSTWVQLWVLAHNNRQHSPGAALGHTSISAPALGLPPAVFGEKQAESQAYELPSCAMPFFSRQENSPSPIFLTDMNITLATNQFSAKIQQSL